MDKYKMICLDIDGTLLNSKHRISPSTKEVIQIVSKEMQIPIILVSARMPKGILFLLKELSISNPIICYSGALIMDDKTNILSNVTIPILELKQVFKLTREMGIHISLYKDDEWYVEKIDEWAEQEGIITNMSPIIMSFTDLFDLWEKEDSGPNKILCMANQNELETLNAKIKDYNSNNLNIYFSKPTYLEMMPNNASKTSAIKVLCEKYGVQRPEVIAIGDNYNDINMIEFAGLGIAMGNAPNEVKQYADYITLSNDEDGVAEAIKKYIL
ncbi:Cof-type HAD-IIB family hydrolase [Clostridium sp. JS66]|uniref:Cof-type HAD-IIB family hydrolase n=1 Tax=Clostridium sp. JS66 TaxID=3064705 RepID=UPI00298DDE8E|nr:Cof-type HAD-IIB family hydrolase [Clostridium sp. JS66]WPC39745.1 Cof-type HAD-IIB family hydrolase [Clostridium sp. JS66]